MDNKESAAGPLTIITDDMYSPFGIVQLADVWDELRSGDSVTIWTTPVHGEAVAKMFEGYVSVINVRPRWA